MVLSYPDVEKKEIKFKKFTSSGCVRRIFYYLCNPKTKGLGVRSESSSAGTARPCQGRGREFESRLSLT